MAKQKWTWFKTAQVAMPLLPIPLGCYFLYKALKSFNRSPPPIATDSRSVLTRPLYGEPVYQVRVTALTSSEKHGCADRRGPRCLQGISFAPSTFSRNMSPRNGP